MKHRSDAMLSAMRKAIAQGRLRKIAFIDAGEASVTYQSIGEELGLSRQRVHQKSGE
jgi:DNA-directed RNA polymerase sigma subunit (sigma70/sigma32)